MKKKDIEKLFDSYETETNNLIEFLNKGIAVFKNSPTEKKDISLLCETVFHRSFVEVESFLSEYILSCINRNHIKYLEYQKDKIIKMIKENEGEWFSSRIAFSKVKNLKMDEVHLLLIPEGGNIAFFTIDAFKKYSKINLAQEYFDKIKNLNKENELVYALSRSFRNCISHRSKKSLDTLNSVINDIRKIPKYSYLPEKINSVANIGSTLKKQYKGKSYAENIIDEMKKVILKIK